MQSIAKNEHYFVQAHDLYAIHTKKTAFKKHKLEPDRYQHFWYDCIAVVDTDEKNLV